MMVAMFAEKLFSPHRKRAALWLTRRIVSITHWPPPPILSGTEWEGYGFLESIAGCIVIVTGLALGMIGMAYYVRVSRK
jgi:hypothetical protein